MKMKLPLNNQTLFHAAGLLSTVASVSGVFSYLLVENNAVDNMLSIGGLMSVGGAVGLGLSIYFGWEVAFNHKGIAKRLAAGLIAASAATLSGYTIYQNTAHPILEQEYTAQVQQASRVLQQQEATTATLQQQQADLRQQIEDLRQQNTTDAASMTALQASDKKGADWQAGQLRKGIETRHAEIAKLSERVENYTQRLTTTPESKTETDNPPTITTDKPVVSWAMLARASMYEVMTALFLLFGSWYKTARKEAENAQAAALHVVTRTAQATLQTLQGTIDALTKTMTQANKTVNALETGCNASELLLVKVTAQADGIHGKAIEGAVIIQQQERNSERLQAEITTMQALLVSAAETAGQLQQGIAPATVVLQDLQNMVVTCNGAIAGANEAANKLFAHTNAAFAPANETANKPFIYANGDVNAGKKELNQESAISMIKNKAIMSTDGDNLTPDVVMVATGWGRPRAIKLLELAWEQGSLERKQAGRGWTYCYPSNQQTAQQLDLTNVIPLTARNV